MRSWFVGMALLLVVLPPRVAAAQSLCFAGKTPYCLTDPFADYWEQNGGLPVFGYPLTMAAPEPTTDMQQTYVTQWVERTRLEDHPEFAGTPYRVLLGLVGKERLIQLARDPRQEPREAGPQPGCLWFTETGHNVCNLDGDLGFKQYWETHGLLLPGLTPYARSLQLFGLPLTAPALETNDAGDTVLTQWFERARFEWHPTNPPPFNVLLGLLGREVGSAFRPVWIATDHAGLSAFQPATGEDLCHPGRPVPPAFVERTIHTDADPPFLELTANVFSAPGQVMNAMSRRDILGGDLTPTRVAAEVYGRDWRVWGEMRANLTEANQNNAVNLQLVVDHQEYIALFQWVLNDDPQETNSGWVTIRTTDRSEDDRRVQNIGIDAAWHSWMLDVRYEQGGARILGMTIDGVHHDDLDIVLPRGPEKEWNSSFAVLLEATNRWLPCDSAAASRGAMQYRTIGMSYRHRFP